MPGNPNSLRTHALQGAAGIWGEELKHCPVLLHDSMLSFPKPPLVALGKQHASNARSLAEMDSSG